MHTQTCCWPVHEAEYWRRILEYIQQNIRKKIHTYWQGMVTAEQPHLSLCYSNAKMTGDKHSHSKGPKSDC